MNDPLYSKELLRLAADAHGAGRLGTPGATGMAYNPACGDRVIVDLSFSSERISQVKHETKACVLAQASASILGQALTGCGRQEVERLREDILAMLESGSGAPSPPFQSYKVFDGAAAYKSRHRCVLLPVEAVLNALKRTDEDGAGR